jgi:hypothetical protein
MKKKMLPVVRGVPLTAAIVLVGLLAGCGGGGDGEPPVDRVVAPPVIPAATLTSAGAGALVLHPSIDSRFELALETPVRITETTGGTADWNFARMQMFRGGREIERFEIGADTINNAGYKRITANQNRTYTIYFRTNQDDFDDIVMTLGFADLKDARQFTTTINLGSFTDVTLSFEPARVPDHMIVRLD